MTTTRRRHALHQVPGQLALRWDDPPARRRSTADLCEWPIRAEWGPWGSTRACGRPLTPGDEDDSEALGTRLCWQHRRHVEGMLGGYLMLRPKLIRSLYWEITVDRQLDEMPDPGRSLVYFIERDGLIKIGTSVSFEKRADDIGKGSSMIRGMTVGPVRVIATMPGDHRHEGFLHRRFGCLRVDGEWFLPDGDLCDFIGRRHPANHDLLEEIRIRHPAENAS